MQLAHEKWFVDDPGLFPTDWSFALRPLTLSLLAAVVLVTVAWRWVAYRLPTPELAPLRRLGGITPYLPRLLAIHLGVSLLALAARGFFLSADLELHRLPAGSVIGLAEGALGVWLITGVRLRAAALLLVAIGPVALAATGPVSLLEAADLVGIAGFLALVPPTNRPYGAADPDPRMLRYGLLALRAGVAVALVSLAFSEKLANPAMARAIVAHYPQLDVFSYVGLDVPVDAFVAIAGAVEVLFGLLVLSGAMPQVAVLVAAVPFNATLLVFGSTELLGHLPVYGVFLTLLAYGSDPRTAEAVRWLPTPARPRAADVREGADVRNRADVREGAPA
ncbi:MAG TPA: hypothetical protein VK453_10490 [Micromonosporaceae bacterium]|nr:hypothetical protein [Micromonosporaceae bacterium]